MAAVPGSKIKATYLRPTSLNGHFLCLRYFLHLWPPLVIFFLNTLRQIKVMNTTVETS